MTDSHIGLRLYFSTELPATNDAAGFEALTWTEVDGLIEGIQFGVSDESIDIPDLSSGFGQGVKGGGMGASSEVMFRDTGNSGQTALLALARSPSGICAVKQVDATGTPDASGVPAVAAGDSVEYAQGYVHSPTKNKPTTTSYKGFTVQFRQNAVEVEAVEPA